MWWFRLNEFCIGAWNHLLGDWFHFKLQLNGLQNHIFRVFVCSNIWILFEYTFRFSSLHVIQRNLCMCLKWEWSFLKPVIQLHDHPKNTKRNHKYKTQVQKSTCMVVIQTCFISVSGRASDLDYCRPRCRSHTFIAAKCRPWYCPCHHRPIKQNCFLHKETDNAIPDLWRISCKVNALESLFLYTVWCNEKQIILHEQYWTMVNKKLQLKHMKVLQAFILAISWVCWVLVYLEHKSHL